MSTASADDLLDLLKNLGLESSVPEFSQTDVTHNPLDIFHAYLAKTIVELTNCEAEIAYNSIQWSTDISNGDLVVVIPKLRLKGINAAEYAFELIQKVLSILPT